MVNDEGSRAGALVTSLMVCTESAKGISTSWEG